jgi:hypothetical protein
MSEYPKDIDCNDYYDKYGEYDIRQNVENHFKQLSDPVSNKGLYIN